MESTSSKDKVRKSCSNLIETFFFTPSILRYESNFD